jgi:hypothetical protein
VANDQPVDVELAQFLGWPSPPFDRMDWATVETELGHRLPTDFTVLMSRFPSGSFADKFDVFSPVQDRKSLDQFQADRALLLSELFHRRETAEAENKPRLAVPYPIHPETGGLIPWGRGDEHAYYWLATDLADPDGWTVVYSLLRDTGWGAYAGTMSNFVYDVLSGRYIDEMLYYEPDEEDRKFFPFD